MTALQLPAGSPVYSLALLLAVAVGAVFWIRQSRQDYRVSLIYLAALGGAFLGAKVAYLVSEGWMHVASDHRWMHWLAGKSVTGALLGGWIGVEACKKALGYTETTGDRYALLVPVGLIIGRVGCLFHGCCPGVPCEVGAFSLTDASGTSRWPAVPVEMAFNLACLAAVLALRRGRFLTGQHFHLYLVAYGLFRFAHEFLRATPKPLGGLSGYQLISLLLVVAGAVAYWHRARHPDPGHPAPPLHPEKSADS